MAVYFPPLENLPIFDSQVFTQGQVEDNLNIPTGNLMVNPIVPVSSNLDYSTSDFMINKWSRFNPTNHTYTITIPPPTLSSNFYMYIENVSEYIISITNTAPILNIGESGSTLIIPELSWLLLMSDGTNLIVKDISPSGWQSPILSSTSATALVLNTTQWYRTFRFRGTGISGNMSIQLPICTKNWFNREFSLKRMGGLWFQALFIGASIINPVYMGTGSTTPIINNGLPNVTSQGFTQTNVEITATLTNKTTSGGTNTIFVYGANAYPSKNMYVNITATDGIISYMSPISFDNKIYYIDRFVIGQSTLLTTQALANASVVNGSPTVTINNSNIVPATGMLITLSSVVYYISVGLSSSSPVFSGTITLNTNYTGATNPSLAFTLFSVSEGGLATTTTGASNNLIVTASACPLAPNSVISLGGNNYTVTAGSGITGTFTVTPTFGSATAGNIFTNYLGGSNLTGVYGLAVGWVYASGSSGSTTLTITSNPLNLSFINNNTTFKILGVEYTLSSGTYPTFTLNAALRTSITTLGIFVGEKTPSYTPNTTYNFTIPFGNYSWVSSGVST